MKKRVLSLLLVFCMLVSLFPTGVLAEEMDPVLEEEDTAAYVEDYAPIEYPEEPLLKDGPLAELPVPVEGMIEVSENVPVGGAADPSSQEAPDEEPCAETGAGASEEAEQVLPEKDNSSAEEAADAPEAPESELDESEAETAEAPELLPVQVRFLVTPEVAILTVYMINEVEEKEELPPEEDGSWFLMPGEYWYTAEAEGYVPTDETSFEVTGEETYVEITVELASSEDEQPISTASTSGTCGENLTWTLDDNGLLTISGTGNMYDYSYQRVSDYAVTTAPWGPGVKTVVIEQGVTSIGWYAFYNCSSLTSVTIPDSVTWIGDSAFSGCSGLTSVTIPNCVTSIGDRAFSGCSGLTSVTIPDSVTIIGNSAFSNCSSLKSVTIPDGVTSIGNCAFYCCSDLLAIQVTGGNSAYTSINGVLFNKEQTNIIAAPGAIAGNYIIPSSVTSILAYAFYNCSRLTTVTIPDSVASIGACAFYNCSRLTTVTIPDSVASIGNYAFNGCYSLTSVMIGNGVTNIGNSAFYNCSSLTSVTIGNSVTSIGGSAFSNCSSLTSVTIPDSVASIGNYAFNGCYSLTSVMIGNGVTNIGDGAFSGCSGLTSVTIPNCVTSIGEYAFSNCSSLTSVTIGNSVTSIGGSAFSNCSSLTEIVLPLVNSYFGYMFGAYHYSVSEYVPASLKTVRITSGGSIPSYYFSGCHSLTSVTIPDSVTSIGEYTFWNCSSLTSVTIPESVTSIGNYAFSGCNSLISVTIPESVTSIGNYAFYNCSNMQVNLSLIGLTSIGSGAFYNCGKVSGNIVLLEGNSSIGAETFYNCAKIESIAIPKSVTSIGENAFYGCIGLKTVYYSGTIQRWSTVSVESGNDPILDAAFVADYHIHQIELQGKKDTTCTEDGYTGDRICVLCNEVVEKGTVIPKHHTPQLKNAKTATIFEDGYTGDEVCRICGETVSTGKVIPKVEVQQGGTVLTDSGTAVQLNTSSVTGSLQWSITEGGAYAAVSSAGLVTPKAVTAETRVTVMAARQDLQDGKVFCVVIEPADLENLVVPGDVDRITPGAFAGSENLKTVQIPDTVTAIGDGAFDNCPYLTIYANPDTVGEQFAETHNFPVVEYPDGRFMLETEYLLLEVGQNAQMRFRNGSDEWGKIAVWTSSDPAAVSVDNSGSVKALKGGTAFIRATINEGGVEYSAECRIDVLDEAKQGSTEITASLPVTKITAELLRTDYARIPVVLNLKQNAVTATDVELADQTVLEDSGMMIEEAEFVGGGKADIRDAFALRIADDRNLELVPIIDVTDSAAVKKVAGSYKSAVILKLSDGTEIQTAEVTVAVKKSQPKLAAKPVVLNSFIQDQTVPVVITGGSVSSVPACDMGFAVLNSNMTVTVKDSAGKNDKATVSITCQPDGWAVKTSLKLTVSNKYTAPKVTLKPAGVTLNRAYSDRVSVPVKVTQLAGMTHTISASGVSGLTAEYDSLKGAVVVGVGSAAAGTYSIPVKVDGKTVANLKVKVIDSSAVTLTAKAAGAIDTAVEKSPILITVTGKNINGEAGTYRVKFLQAKGKEAAVEVKDLFTYTQSGNVITVTGKDALKNYVKGYTYTAEVSSSGGTAKPVKLTVKASAKTPAPSVTLKAAGSIDVLRPGTELVLTPTFKNWFDYDEAKFGLRLSNPNLDYRYKDGVFTVFAKEGADVDPALNQAWMTYEGRDVSAKPVKLSLKMGKAVITQSTKAITLSKNDRYDRQSVILSLSDNSLYDIRNARVTMTDASGNLTLIDFGNGEYAIGYKGNKLPGNIAKLKNSNVKLVVFLQGNGGSKPNATLSVKVNFS